MATEVKDAATGEIKKAVDFDALREQLGDVAEGARERYRFTWPGKCEAKEEARRPIAKTLRPIKERSKNWDDTHNLYIEGDNLDALKILRETYAGKIKMIYIDPPYNTGHDFIYHDDFKQDADEYAEGNGDYNDEGGRLVANPESNGRFHSDWCSMMYPRLLLSRDLLTSSGVIMINIGESEIDNTVKIADEIFGQENRITIFSRAMKLGGAKGKFYTPSVDYIIAYAKNISEADYFRAPFTNEQIEVFYKQRELNGPHKGQLYGEERLFKASLDPRPNQRYYIKCPDGSLVIPPGVSYPKELNEGAAVLPTAQDKVWKWIYSRYIKEFQDGRIVFKKTGISNLVDENGYPSPWNIYNKLYLSEQKEKGVVPSNLLTRFENRQSSKELKELDIPFDYAKPVALLEYLEEIVGIKNEDVVLDFFSGSSTTAHAAMWLNAKDSGNRRFIMVQLPEVCDEKSEAAKAGYHTICEIGEERIRRAGEKIKAEVEKSNEQLELGAEPKQVPDIGFRVLRIDSSNYRDVRRSPNDFSQGMLDDMVDVSETGRSPLDKLFECLPAFQLPYDSSVEVLDAPAFAGHTVFSVNGGQLVACFDDDVPESVLRGMAALDPKPSYAVVGEAGLRNSQTVTNFAEIFRQSTDAVQGSTQVRVI